MTSHNDASLSILSSSDLLKHCTFHFRGLNVPCILEHIAKSLTDFIKRCPNNHIEVSDFCHIKIELMSCIYLQISVKEACVVSVTEILKDVATQCHFEFHFSVSQRLLMTSNEHSSKNQTTPLSSPVYSSMAKNHSRVWEPVIITIRSLFKGRYLSIEFLSIIFKLTKHWNFDVLRIVISWNSVFVYLNKLILPNSLTHEGIPLDNDLFASHSMVTDQTSITSHIIELKVRLSKNVSEELYGLRLLWDSPNMVKFYRELQTVCSKWLSECVIQEFDDFLCRPKTRSLIVFGLNETLICEDSLNELLREIGEDPMMIEHNILTSKNKTSSPPSSVTSPFCPRDTSSTQMQETALSYETSLTELECDPSRTHPTERQEIFERKLLLLEGHSVSCLTRCLSRLTLTRHAFFVCRALTLLGYRLALISQGLSFAATVIGQYLGFEYVLSNKLEVINKQLTGRLTATSEQLVDTTFLVDPLRKIDWLQLLRDKLSIPRKNIIVVADHKHAAFLFSSCAAHIYFNAKIHNNLIIVLLMIGLSWIDIQQLADRFKDKFETDLSIIYTELYVYVTVCNSSDSPSLKLDEIHRNLCSSVANSPFIRMSRSEIFKNESVKELKDLMDCSPLRHTMSMTSNKNLSSEHNTHHHNLQNTQQHSLQTRQPLKRYYKTYLYIDGCIPLTELLDNLKPFETETSHIIALQQILFQHSFCILCILEWEQGNEYQDKSTRHDVNDSFTNGQEHHYLETFRTDMLNLGLRLHSSTNLMTSLYDRLNSDKQSTWMLSQEYIKLNCIVVREPRISMGLLYSVFKVLSIHGLIIEELIQLTASTDRTMQSVRIRGSLCVPRTEKKELFQKKIIRLIKNDVLSICKENHADVAIQNHNVLRYCRRLVVFDMDSTLIQEEVIDELARVVGNEKEVSYITELAMTGKIDFYESLKRRVQMLKGMSRSMIDTVESKIHFTPGAKRLCLLLRLMGFRLAVISGGFTRFARYVKRELGLHHAFANTLGVDPDTGLLNGEVRGPIVTPQRKATILQMLADLECCSLEQVIAVGDGANDIAMLMKAGMGVAFCAKPKVQEKAEFRINQKDLSNLLFLIGISSEAANRFELHYSQYLKIHLHQSHSSHCCYPTPCVTCDENPDIQSGISCDNMITETPSD